MKYQSIIFLEPKSYTQVLLRTLQAKLPVGLVSSTTEHITSYHQAQSLLFSRGCLFFYPLFEFWSVKRRSTRPMRLVVRLPCKRTALFRIMKRERRKKKASWIPLAKTSGSVGCFTRFIGTEGNMTCFMVLEVCVWLGRSDWSAYRR